VLEGIAIKPTGLTFQPQTQGTTSADQTITLVSGVSAVNISSISLIGPNSDDFAISSNTCGTTLAANSQCTIYIDFTPSGPGTRTASVAIVDNVTGQPAQSLVASISGTTSTVPDFSVTTALSTATISAGQSATFTLQVTSVNGFNKPITLACSGLPVGATCSISPNPVTPAGAATPVTVTMDTAVRNLLPPGTSFRRTPWQLPSHPLNYLLWLAVLLMAALLAQARRRPALAAFGFAVVLLIALTGCGGGNSAGVPAGTQAGTYTITVSATSGSLVHNTTLTLQVK
jgi:large repetitive protein